MRIHGYAIPVPPAVTRANLTRTEAPARGAASAPAAPPRAEASGLLELLTPEERAFFEARAALGPLTYRPGRSAPDPAPAPLGQRVDVTG